MTTGQVVASQHSAIAIARLPRASFIHTDALGAYLSSTRLGQSKLPWAFRPALPSPRRQVLFEEPVAHRVEMDAADPVPPVRVLHEVELLVEVDQPVDHALRALEVHVVVAGAVDDQQLALRALRRS